MSEPKDQVRIYKDREGLCIAITFGTEEDTGILHLTPDRICYDDELTWEEVKDANCHDIEYAFCACTAQELREIILEVYKKRIEKEEKNGLPF